MIEFQFRVVVFFLFGFKSGHSIETNQTDIEGANQSHFLRMFFVSPIACFSVISHKSDPVFIFFLNTHSGATSLF